ncbi:hypothetical protein EWF20_09925 [Sulfolobus sp. S-194]|uniref:hypothetical protein n=1 Tax=Sulfolobus sp. S-194 TaxID=2512240 RepID=UPI0014372902|nr:hypothetical protein [Sulfolobus sp. S-194]QIW24438.1 hypothetical protein EWF20_09925 [Sulfolobus sp. S-194]
MKRKELLKLITHFKNVENGIEKLKPELQGSKYYHVYVERKVSVDEDGNARIVSIREFLPIYSGISEEYISFKYEDVKGISYSKINYIKRENLLSREKLNAEAELQQSKNQLLIRMKFLPPLRVGDKVKLKYTVRIKGFVSDEENIDTVQVASFTHYFKLLIYLPKRPKRAEVYKVTFGDNDIISKIPLGEDEDYNFVVNDTMIKFEIYRIAFSAYSVIWEI